MAEQKQIDYRVQDLEHSFLAPLKNIHKAPASLWLRGKLPSGRPKVVSIVGSRRCTEYGKDLAYRAAYELAQHGIVVVSGLAYGIDAWAHRGCLDGGGVTVAILGTPIDQIYPKINDSLAARILERGAILSEYAPGTDIRSWHFLERNRIVAGLCDALLIVEASERSGTLTTASMAINSGKDIFVVPGDLTRPMSIGCNRMIRSGANIYTCIDDILDCVLPKHARRAMVERTFRNELEKTIYASIKSGISDGDEIVSQLQISTSELNQALTMMQLRGLVMPLGANHWATIAG